MIIIKLALQTMENTRYQNPKTAIIRLLKSQGCCPSQESPKNSHLQQMLQYREQLSIQTAKERARLTEIPCAITLTQQIAELKEVINGLGRENRGRMDQLMRLKQKTNVSYEVEDVEQKRQHQRLQQEYANLLRTLEATNQNNRRLVQRLARW